MLKLVSNINPAEEKLREALREVYRRNSTIGLIPEDLDHNDDPEAFDLVLLEGGIIMPGKEVTEELKNYLMAGDNYTYYEDRNSPSGDLKLVVSNRTESDGLAQLRANMKAYDRRKRGIEQERQGNNDRADRNGRTRW